MSRNIGFYSCTTGAFRERLETEKLKGKGKQGTPTPSPKNEEQTS
jgi:hypothetical protein